MRVSEEALLRSGFSPADLRKVKNNLESYGGTLGDAIQDLSRRFIIAMVVVLCCIAVFIFLLFFGSSETIFSGGIALLCGIAVAIFVQPPVLSYKSWRFQRTNRN
ncbi:hypothetical protein [Pantoea sp.]|uniref:hypothetical protein n=1 Tax=Pantoea sp. TaxID=69393 RepID=UPI0028AAE2F1|nr:hypothetical protein [Pantoea sp.]